MSTDSQPSAKSVSPIRLGLIIVLVAAVVGTAVWAVLNERPDDAIAASIGDHEFTVGQLNEVLETAPEATESAAAMEFAADRLSNFLIVEAVADELADRGEPITDADTADAIAQVEAQGAVPSSSAAGALVVRERAAVQALQRYADDVAFDGDVDVALPEFLCSSHILVETEEEALGIIAELDAGLAFAEAAMEFSTGPSGPNGGDLGCVDAAQFVPEYGDGARAAGAGMISAPVQTQFGWHVIDVRSIGELSAENHPELSAEEIERTIIELEGASRQPIAQAAFEEVVEAALATVSASGYVNPQYGTWDTDVSFVVAPSGVSG